MVSIPQGFELVTPDQVRGIDLTRPILENIGGSFSTEESITITEQALNQGRPTNIPTIVNGQRVSDDEAIRFAVQSGEQFNSFDSIEEAVSAARSRSERIGRLREKDRFQGIPAGFELVSPPGQAVRPEIPEAGQPLQRAPAAETTPLGRIGEAFAQPFQEADFGLPETAKVQFDSRIPVVKTFNDLILNGVASPAFAALQGLGVGANAAIDAMAQTAIEVGVISEAKGKRGARDLKGMLEVAAAFTVSGAPALATRASQSRLATGRTPQATPQLTQELRNLPERVPATRGDITRDPNIQAFEDESLKGLFGPEAQRRAQGIRQQQSEGLQANVEALQRQATGRVQAAAPEEAGLGALEATRGIKNLAKQQRGAINTAYTEARKLDASIEADLIKDFGKSARASLLEEGFDVEVMQQLSRRLNDFETIGDDLTPASVTKLETIRKRIVRDEKSTRITNASESEALRQVKKQLDEHMSDLLDRGLVEGNQEAITAWKGARDLRTDFGRRFTDNKVIRRVLDEDLTQEQSVNLLFGGSQMGFKTDAGAIVGKIRNIVGPDSDAFRGLKEEAILRLTKNQTGDFSGVKFDKAFQKAMRENQQLMRSLFTKAEIDEINAVAKAARRITEKAPGATNASNSFIAFQRSRRRAASRLPFAGDFIEGMLTSAANRKAARRINDETTILQDAAQFRRDPDMLRRALEVGFTFPADEEEER